VSASVWYPVPILIFLYVSTLLSIFFKLSILFKFWVQFDGVCEFLCMVLLQKRQEYELYDCLWMWEQEMCRVKRAISPCQVFALHHRPVSSALSLSFSSSLARVRLDAWSLSVAMSLAWAVADLLKRYIEHLTNVNCLRHFSFPLS